jgi:hypothetical protein
MRLSFQFSAMPHVTSTLLSIAGTVLISTISTQQHARAAEVVIRIAATIELLDGNFASIPTSLEIGDTITTEFFFEAADFVGNQAGALGSQRLVLGDIALESDNSANLVLNTGVFLPPIDPPDTLLLTCSSPTNVFPGCNTNRFPHDERLIWDPTLTLFANPGAFQSLADVRSLTSLTSVGGTGIFQIEISELDASQASLHRLLSIRAIVTDLTVVPEPAPISLLLIGFSSACVVAERRR